MVRIVLYNRRHYLSCRGSEPLTGLNNIPTKQSEHIGTTPGFVSDEKEADVSLPQEIQGCLTSKVPLRIFSSAVIL